MALHPTTHTIEGILAVEVLPHAFVTAEGDVIGRIGATKWGGWEGLEILEYDGPETTVEVDELAYARAERVSEVETQLHEEFGSGE